MVSSLGWMCFMIHFRKKVQNQEDHPELVSQDLFLDLQTHSQTMLKIATCCLSYFGNHQLSNPFYLWELSEVFLNHFRFYRQLIVIGLKVRYHYELGLSLLVLSIWT